ncbi:MAG: MBL fold metallo-hydrolase [Ruminococcaceae bacterium]|nr:MBL fold metallo-hydrolase [Oscillospiraceae bacterium]
MKLTFVGAAHEVTGSCTLIELSGKYYIVDFGMEQGVDVFENVELPVAPGEIEAVFLTHAHVDHSGMIPKLYKNGFRGKIYTTVTTKNLCNIMLSDSAHIQESDAEWKSRKALRAGRPAVEPVYTLEDAMGAMKLFYGCDYGREYRIAEDVSLRFTDVGHLLGSAAVELWLSEGGVTKKVVFSGDVGNTDQPIIKDPQTVEEADFLIIESTYGNRDHEKPKDAVEGLAEVLQSTLDRGGTLVIPSFAVGRTQEILYAIRSVKQRGLLKGHDIFPVYVDSPLAQEATAVFLQCDRAYFDKETLAVLENGYNPIWFDGIILSVTAEQSKAINFDERPKVIISSSGMCEAGRVRHHLKHNLWKKESTVLFVGYQSPKSLGRALLDGAKKVKLFSTASVSSVLKLRFECR